MGELNEQNDHYERTLYVCNFDERVDQKLLEEIFVQAGPIESVTVREKLEKISSSGKSPEKFRFAFIEFSHVESVIFACKIMDAVELYGRKLKVTPRDNSKQKEIYTQNGMREKSLEMHRERHQQRERNRSDGFEQKQQLFRYPNQPTPSNQLSGISRVSWSAPIPVERGGGQSFSSYNASILPPPPPPPPLQLNQFQFNTPRTSEEYKTVKNSKQQRAKGWQKASYSYKGQSNNKNRNISQPQRHSWPKPFQR